MIKKYLAILLCLGIMMFCLVGCKANFINGAVWCVDTYEYKDHEYLVFTNGTNGIEVVEVEE